MPIPTRFHIDESDLSAPPLMLKSGSESLIVHVLFVDLVGYSKLSMEGQERASCELVGCVTGTPTYQQATEEGRLTCLDTGDGMALIFEGNPTDAAFAALEIALARGAQPARPIRMGLHSGPAIRVRDINGRQNFKGAGVNIAQRVMDCAHGGQITLTEHYATILRSYEGWSSIIVSESTRTVKHGLKLRVCMLRHENSPRQPLAEVLHRELPPVPLTMRWTAILAVIAVFAAGIWAVAMYGVADHDLGAGSSSGVNGLPAK